MKITVEEPAGGGRHDPVAGADVKYDPDANWKDSDLSSFSGDDEPVPSRPNEKQIRHARKRGEAGWASERDKAIIARADLLSEATTDNAVNPNPPALVRPDPTNLYEKQPLTRPAYSLWVCDNELCNFVS